MNAPVANNLLQKPLFPSRASALCSSCLLACQLKSRWLHSPPDECLTKSGGSDWKYRRERAILSAGTLSSSSLIGGGGWRNRVWVPLKRLVRNRGCFKRTSDGEVVKRPAAASLSLHFLSRSCGATVVNLLCPFLDPCLWTLNYLDYYHTTHSLSSSCAATSLLE